MVFGVVAQVVIFIKASFRSFSSFHSYTRASLGRKMSSILMIFFVYDVVRTKSISSIQIHIQLDTLQTKTVNSFHSYLISFSFHFNFGKENCFCRAICSYFPYFQPTHVKKHTHTQ